MGTHGHAPTDKMNTITPLFFSGWGGGALCGDTCVSVCFHCCPLGCAVCHTVLPACLPPMGQHPVWTQHCSFSPGTADAEDVPLGTHWWGLKLYCLCRDYFLSLSYVSNTLNCQKYSAFSVFLIAVSWWIKPPLSNSWWFSLSYHSLLSTANWLNLINREACSVTLRSRARGRTEGGLLVMWGCESI